MTSGNARPQGAGSRDRFVERPSDMPGPDRQSSIELLGTWALWGVVGGLFLLLGFMLSLGAMWSPLSPAPYFHASNPPDRDGIELAAFPLAAVLATILRPGSDRVAAWRACRIGAWLPLLAAIVMVAIAAYFRVTWDGPPQFPLRLVGFGLAAAAGYVGVLLHPRLTATLAGALATPALFGLVAHFSFSVELVRELRAGPEYCFALPYRMCPGAEGVGIILAGAAAALALLGAGLGATRLRLWPSDVGHAVWGGALMLYLAVYGYVFILATID